MRTVTVTGHGTASVVPDTAVVRLAAVHRAPVARRGAGRCASRARAAVVTALRATSVVSTAEPVGLADHDDEGQPAGLRGPAHADHRRAPTWRSPASCWRALA